MSPLFWAGKFGHTFTVSPLVITQAKKTNSEGGNTWSDLIGVDSFLAWAARLNAPLGFYLICSFIKKNG